MDEPRLTSQRRRIRAEPQRGIVHFHKVFKGFQQLVQFGLNWCSGPFWGDMQETHVFPLFLEVPGRQHVCLCGMHGLAVDLAANLIVHRLI